VGGGYSLTVVDNVIVHGGGGVVRRLLRDQGLFGCALHRLFAACNLPEHCHACVCAGSVGCLGRLSQHGLFNKLSKLLQQTLLTLLGGVCVRRHKHASGQRALQHGRKKTTKEGVHVGERLRGLNFILSLDKLDYLQDVRGQRQHDPRSVWIIVWRPTKEYFLMRNRMSLKVLETFLCVSLYL